MKIATPGKRDARIRLRARWTGMTLLPALAFLAGRLSGAPGEVRAETGPTSAQASLYGAKKGSGEMQSLAHVTVGIQDGDIRGADNRALQAAVDYVAQLGGGVVEIGAGEYLMRDSLHLRSHVTVRGQGAKTVLRKARAHASPLNLDGDYGEEQITVEKPEGFEVGDGVAIWDKNAGGFHTTVARITGRDGNTFAIS